MNLFFIFSINGSTQATSPRAPFAEHHFNAKVCHKRSSHRQLALNWTNSILFTENTLYAVLIDRSFPLSPRPFSPINLVNVERTRPFHASQKILCTILCDKSIITQFPHPYNAPLLLVYRHRLPHPIIWDLPC